MVFSSVGDVARFLRGYLREHWAYLTAPGAYRGADLVRALAIVSVIGFHTVGAHTVRVFHLGWIGVDIFFILSGFLIGGIIIDDLRRGTFRFARFYKRRFFRILPLYYVATAATMVVASRTLATPATAGDYAYNALLNGLFLQTYALTFPSGIIPAFSAGGTWSLVIEEFFYLLCPLFLWFLFRVFGKDLRKLGWAMAAVVATAPLLHFVTYRATMAVSPGNQPAIFFNFILPHSRYDELATGVLIAILVRLVATGRSVRIGLSLLSATMFALFAGYLFGKPDLLANPALLTWETSLLPTWFCVMIGSFFLAVFDSRVTSPLVTVVAKLSYALYLFHFFANTWFPGRLVVTLAAMLGLAYAASLLIEYPFLRLYKGPARAAAR